jgi:hypothetical protein
MLPLMAISFTGDGAHLAIITMLGVLLVLALWGRWR